MYYVIQDNVFVQTLRINNHYDAITEVERRIGYYKSECNIDAVLIENDHQLLIVNKAEMKTYEANH